MDDAAMAYWYNLSWSVKQRTVNPDGSITPGHIERLEDLSLSYEMESAKVKKKKEKSVARDIYGNVIKDKKGKPKTQKEKYIEPKLKPATVTFKTVYQVATGTTDIIAKIEEIRSMIGCAGPLVLGRQRYAADPITGEQRLVSYPRVLTVYQMQLTDVKIGSTELDELGRMTKATVDFTLKEATDKKIIKASIQFPGESAKELLKFWLEDPSKVPDEYWSALDVSPDPNVKAMVKQKKEDKKKKKKSAKGAARKAITALSR
jgi:hypothetical protein